MEGHDPDLLTKREHEVLHGVLEHKTAKEIALDLGVSHHAIEKRLKRARQKLGVATSLEAARLYRARYGQAVSDPSDLDAPDANRQDSTPTTANSGGRSNRIIAMFSLTIIASVVAYAALVPFHPEADASKASANTWQEADAPFKYFNRVSLSVPPGTDVYEAAFAKTDRDNSGAIERSEFIAAEFSVGYPAFKGFEQEAGLIFDFMDKNGNDLVEPAEFATVGFLDDEGNEYLFEVTETAQP